MILKYKQLLEQMDIEQDFTEMVDENNKYISAYLFNKYMLVTENFKALEEFYSHKYCFLYNSFALFHLLKDNTFVNGFGEILQKNVYNFVYTVRNFNFIDYKEKEEVYEILNYLLYITNIIKKQNPNIVKNFQYNLLVYEIEEHRFIEELNKKNKEIIVSYKEVLENDFLIFMLYYAYKPKEEFLNESILQELKPYFNKLDKLKEYYNTIFDKDFKDLVNENHKLIRKNNI